jgi:O-antigen/teichoic acid export membrane protein
VPVAAPPSPQSPPAPPVSSTLSRMIRGTFWLALKTPVSVVIALWSVPLTQEYIGYRNNDAYLFAWGFGYIQFLLEFGMGSSLQKQMVDAYSRGDRDGVNRTIACGMNFYATVALIQMAVLLGIAYFWLPPKFQGNSLVIGLLWVQVLTTPFFGMSTVVGSVLQAARRYDIIPRLELAIVVLRFGLLALGYWTGAPFLAVVIGQLAIQVGLSLGPGLYVMVKELGYVPHFLGARRSDYAAMFHISLYMTMMQWSVVLADKVDTTVLGYALPDAHSESLLTVYQNVSRPFLQIRQTGWTLAYLVMPAVVSLAVGGDRASLERIKFDGTRMLVGLLTPVTLLAGIYAAPFLALWVGPKFVPDAWMLQLFLVATLPLVLSVLTQMAIGMGKVKLVAISSLVGSLLNLPISWYLTRAYGVSGVIWGTVLTTLFSNLLVPGVYLFRVLEIRPSTFLARTLSPPMAGAFALVVACWAFRSVVSPEPAGVPGLARALPFLANLAVGSVAYLAGYALMPAGRGDLSAIARKLLRRPAPDG